MNPLDHFVHLPGLLAQLELEDLIAVLDLEVHHLTMYGKTFPVPRLLAMYGNAYTYSGIKHPARALPAPLEALRCSLGVQAGVSFNSVLCNLYRGGDDSVSWHSDNDYASGGQPVVASASFGATRRFRVRSFAKPRVTHNFDLAHGDVVIMGPEAQKLWQHCVPKTSKAVGPRLNLTFRHIEETNHA